MIDAPARGDERAYRMMKFAKAEAKRDGVEWQEVSQKIMTDTRFVQGLVARYDAAHPA